MRTLAVTLTALSLLAACGKPSDEPDNPPVDTTPSADAGTTAAGASSFTEAQARSAIEGAGYTDVTELTQNDQGVWVGKASKNGAATTVSVDYRGSVSEGSGQPTGDAGAGGPPPPAEGASGGDAAAAKQ